MEQTRPLIDLYESRGLNVTVNGVGTVEEITERILEAIEDPS